MRIESAGGLVLVGKDTEGEEFCCVTILGTCRRLVLELIAGVCWASDFATGFDPVSIVKRWLSTTGPTFPVFQFAERHLSTYLEYDFR